MHPRTYPSDLSDAEWLIVEPLVPKPLCGTERGGHPVIHSRRELHDAIFYVLRTGCAWRQLPADFPPWKTVHDYFTTCTKAGVLDAIHDSLRDMVRASEG